MSREERPICGAVDEVLGPGLEPIGTEVPGHDGDHLATDPATGREVSRWARVADGGGFLPPGFWHNHAEPCGVDGCVGGTRIGDVVLFVLHELTR